MRRLACAFAWRKTLSTGSCLKISSCSFWFSAELASESEEPTPEQRYISSEEIAALEAAIDIAMGRVPPLRSFILPGRSEAASRLHFARTLARRAERRLVELSTEISVRHVLMRYINRLSDCLYALARAEDHDAHQNEIIQKVAERYLAAVQHQPQRSRLCLCLFRSSTNSPRCGDESRRTSGSGRH
jgi:ATP:cob(I)alamin adenosyltransferase